MSARKQASTTAGPDAGSTAVSPRVGRRPLLRWIVRALMLVGACVLVYVWYVGSHVDSSVYGATDLADRPKTQIIIWDEHHNAVQASRLVDLPADQLWRVVTDQARFDQFMPYVRSTTVEPLPNGKILEKQLLDLPFGSYNVELEITLNEQAQTRQARWRQVNGTLAFNEGSWVVERAGQQSILRYQVAAGTNWLPQCAVNFALRPRLNRLLEAVEKRVRDLNQNDPNYFTRQ